MRRVAVVGNVDMGDLAPVNPVLFGLHVLVDDAERADAAPRAPLADFESLKAGDGLSGFVMKLEFAGSGEGGRSRECGGQVERQPPARGHEDS